MAAYNIAYLGGRILGYRCLEILHRFCQEHPDKFELCFVVPHTEEEKFSASWNAELKPLARRLGLAVFDPPPS